MPRTGVILRRSLPAGRSLWPAALLPASWCCRTAPQASKRLVSGPRHLEPLKPEHSPIAHDPKVFCWRCREQRQRFSKPRRRTTKAIHGDGEGHQLVAGYWILRVKSKQEAIEWIKRCPNPHEEASEIEIRQMFELEDFG